MTWAQDKAERGREMSPQGMPTEDKLRPVQLLRKASLKSGEHRPKALPRKGRHMPEAPLPHKDKHEIEVLPQGSPNKGGRRGGREAPWQGRGTLDAPSRADGIEGRLATRNLGKGPVREHSFESNRVH